MYRRGQSPALFRRWRVFRGWVDFGIRRYGFWGRLALSGLYCKAAALEGVRFVGSTVYPCGQKPAPFPALARFSGTGLVFGMAMKIFRGRWRCPALIAVRAPMWEALAGRRVSGDAGGKVGGWGIFALVMGDRPGGGVLAAAGGQGWAGAVFRLEANWLGVQPTYWWNTLLK